MIVYKYESNKVKDVDLLYSHLLLFDRLTILLIKIIISLVSSQTHLLHYYENII